jgi:hypothetical protein
MTGTDARGDRSTKVDATDACPRCGQIEELENFRLASLIGEAVDLKERLDALEARLWAPRSPELRLVPETACDAARSLHRPIDTVPEIANAMTGGARVPADELSRRVVVALPVREVGPG